MEPENTRVAKRVVEKWIQSASHHDGRVRKYLNIPEGQNIPLKALNKAIDDLHKIPHHTKAQTSILRALNMAKILRRINDENKDKE